MKVPSRESIHPLFFGGDPPRATIASHHFAICGKRNGPAAATTCIKLLCVRQ